MGLRAAPGCHASRRGLPGFPLERGAGQGVGAGRRLSPPARLCSDPRAPEAFKQWFSGGGQFCPPGTFGDMWRHCWLSPVRGAPGILWARGQGCCHTPSDAQGGLPQGMARPSHRNCAVENRCSTDTSQERGSGVACPWHRLQAQGSLRKPPAAEGRQVGAGRGSAPCPPKLGEQFSCQVPPAQNVRQLVGRGLDLGQSSFLWASLSSAPRGSAAPGGQAPSRTDVPPSWCLRGFSGSRRASPEERCNLRDTRCPLGSCSQLFPMSSSLGGTFTWHLAGDRAAGTPPPLSTPPPPPCAAGAGGVHEELRQEVSQRSGEVPVFERVNQSGVSQGMSGSLLMSRNLVFLPSRPAGCCCAAGIPADAMLSGSCPRAGALRAAGRPHGLGRRDTQATLTGFPPECEE